MVLITNNPIPEPIQKSGLSISFEPVFTVPNSGKNRAPRLNFLTSSGDSSDRLFVNDTRGQLYVYDDDRLSEYLNLKNEIGDSFISGRQTGFINFAFDPDFSNNGIFYTIHTEKKNDRTADFQVTKPIVNNLGELVSSSHHDAIVQWTANDPSANIFNGDRREILRVEQPYKEHNIGQIAFNPNSEVGDRDYGLLYISTADGGSDGFPVGNTDPLDNGQDLGVVLGKILRIDPNGDNSTNGKYGIPEDNPFVNDGDDNTLGEIWAYGFRNPHRFSWDTQGDGKLLIVDIGQNFIEEVNLGIKGGNYGWGEREGTFLINDDNENEIFTLPEDDFLNNYIYPVAQYDHDIDGSIAIAGGFVYRGSAIPELTNQYVFADFGQDARFFHVDVDDLVNAQQATIYELSLFDRGEETSFLDLVGDTRTDVRFGTDRFGELYVTNKRDGIVRKIVTNVIPNIVSEINFTAVENTIDVGTLTQEDIDLSGVVEFEITAGTDKDLFDLDRNTGEIVFIDAPNFENPLDDDRDNIYNFEITATDLDNPGLSIPFEVTVTVTDTDESLTNNPPQLTPGVILYLQSDIDREFNYTIPENLFTDADADALTISIVKKPKWWNYNSQTRELTGKTPEIWETSRLVIEASDGYGSIRINPKIIITQPLPVIGDDTTIVTGSTNDSIIANNGTNDISSGRGDDYIKAGNGIDTIVAGVGNDYIDANAGNDYIEGNRGNDIIIGGAGSDTLIGNDGKDILIGGEDDDFLTGGSGRDIFAIETASGSDTVTGFKVGADRFGLTDSLVFSDLSIIGNGRRNTDIFDGSNNLLVTINNADPVAIDNPDNFINLSI